MFGTEYLWTKERTLGYNTMAVKCTWQASERIVKNPCIIGLMKKAWDDYDDNRNIYVFKMVPGCTHKDVLEDFIDKSHEYSPHDEETLIDI